MSKLFDTLERIRENEESQHREPAAPAPGRRGPGRRRLVLWAILCSAVAGLVLFVLITDFSSLLKPGRHPTPAAPVEPAAAPAGPRQVATGQSGTTRAVNPVTRETRDQWRDKLADSDLTPEQRATLLNNIAAYYILDRQYWQGLSYLEQAIRLAPGAAEPLINYGVALTELGLYGVAIDYFERAGRINPDQPMLVKNIALLARNKIMGTRLLSLYGQKNSGASGKSQPGAY
ncbi:MAG: tetratricopeptide repeat protein [Desulfobacterales bacterium]|nr:tetratricopeptide repeat protein [Desulfobacterales bacterium]